jgi:hypothetical protein
MKRAGLTKATEHTRLDGGDRVEVMVGWVGEDDAIWVKDGWMDGTA